MEKNLIQGNSYLVKRGMTVSKVIVLEVTEKCYQFRYESGLTDWQEIKYFHGYYDIIEDLGNKTVQQLLANQ